MDWLEQHWKPVLIVYLTILLVAIAVMATLPEPHSASELDFERRDAIAQACFESERYAREECVVLAGGNTLHEPT